MSTDYDIKCKKCGDRIETVVSGSIAYGDTLWSNEESLVKLRDFLLKHRGHELVFDDFSDE